MAFRLYLDEVGNDDLGNAEDQRYRFLSLTGVIIENSHSRDWLIPHLDELKRRIFRADPDDPIILHRRDIYQAKGPFGCLAKNEELKNTFDTSILWILNRTNYTVITAVIDKLEMQRQAHWQQIHPYHYLMGIIVEKFTLWLRRQNSSGDIMPESRQKKQNDALQRAYNDVRQEGTRYTDSNTIQYHIRGSKLKFRAKEKNIAGLQICDLIAHPSHMHIRSCEGHDVNIAPFSQRIVPILVNSKYDRSRYGIVRGYGIKYLP